VDNIEKLIMEGIIGLIPLYIDMKGNSTRAITKENSEVYIYKSIRTVLNIIARYFTLDLNASRKYYGGLIGYSNIVPIPFNRENIFVPIKVRSPISKNDGSFGYFNIANIKGVREKSEGIEIILDGNIFVKSLQSMKSIERHIRDGEIVRKIYQDRGKLIVMEDRSDFYSEFNKPATKGDIAALRSELLDIKSKLR